VFEEYATHGSLVVTKISSRGMPEAFIASPTAFSVPNSNPIPFSDMVFFNDLGALAIHISGIDVTESVLERTKRLARFVIERNAKLPLTRSKPSPSSSSHHVVTPG